ncbi:MAG: hypothetical protein ABIZ80_14400, partial [Bryobacteraceae bacterium]
MVTTGNFAISRRRLFGLAASTVTGGAAAGHPELAVVSRLGADHPLMLSQVSQLLENGVYFDGGDNHTLHESLPSRLEGFKAVLFDEPAFRAAIDDPQSRNRLESWVRKGGFVFRIDNPAGAIPREQFSPRMLFDIVASHTVHYMLTQAPLTP